MSASRLTGLVVSRGRRVRWAWSGGAYIDLTFGFGSSPSEVINVWDDDTDRTEVPFTAAGGRAAVDGWIASNDAEWPEWYEAYLRNAAY